MSKRLIKLTDVLYIQGLEMNLISVAKLIVKVAEIPEIQFGKHGCRIMSRGETAAVVDTQFVGVLIESKRRSKKTKKRDVFEYRQSNVKITPH